MRMKRQVNKELLDDLPPADPRAVRSRQDLLRLNAFMGHAALGARWLGSALAGIPGASVIDLGAGDGCFLLSVARRLAAQGVRARAILLDREPVVSPETRAAFEAMDWGLEVLKTDALSWARQARREDYAAVFANHFIHHFCDGDLRELLHGAASQTRFFLALEPRRWWPAAWVSRLVNLIGCNAVTRHDATVSVEAGFVGTELSRLWPDGTGWALEEGPAGWATHLFVARRP